ncbi:DegT/DnrJ/EryC1/StrS family aminotransferase [Francisellaceae bacterium]|nr:DegT/DnrJ/EryC1/StrS family aminotransferase [Francisellaceae bacterium]
MKPFFDIQAQYIAHKDEINCAIQEVLDSGKFIMGPQVKLLESQLEDYTGSKNCISCANGTDALQIALMAIGIKPGDEIITTPFTFIATAESIALLGAVPVFIDIEEDSYLIDHTLIDEKISNKTKAIIPVSLYGQIADMDEINRIAKEASKTIGHKIYVIEDAAQSFGAEYKGKKSCNVSDIATTSFFPTKPLGCYGDGGAMFTNDSELATAMKQIRVHGQSKRYHHTRVGVNSRLDTIQAAILMVKLKYFDHEVEKRCFIAEKYGARLKNVDDIITPVVMPHRKHVYGQYTIRTKNRATFIEKYKQEGTPTTIHYPVPLNKQPAFDTGVFCPISDRLSNEVVSLPMCLYT